VNDPIDQENFLVNLTWGEWRVILTYVQGGPYSAVANVVSALATQLTPQLEAVMAATKTAEPTVQPTDESAATPTTLN
jgi:hypothetical protein